MVLDLGVIDADLSMQSHVRRTVSRCFAVLRQLRSNRRQISPAVFQSLIVALVLSRLNYCNSVLYGLPASHIHRLQYPVCSECCCAAHLRNPPVRAHHQRAHQPTLAVRSGADLLQTGRPDLPSHPRQRIYISAVMFHSSCRHDVESTAAILSLSATGSAARSSDYRRQAGVPSANVWNNLPLHVTSAPSLAIFRQRLKTFLFTQSYPDIHISLIIIIIIIIRQFVRRHNMPVKSLQGRRTEYATRIKLHNV